MKEVFEDKKKRMIQENEEKYGEEIINSYGVETVNQSNEKFMKMSQEDFNKLNSLNEQLLLLLKEAYLDGNVNGEKARKCALLHKEWITMCWGDYSHEAHIGVCNMYVDDDRFRKFYDKEQEGLAEFLRDSVKNLKD